MGRPTREGSGQIGDGVDAGKFPICVSTLLTLAATFVLESKRPRHGLVRSIAHLCHCQLTDSRVGPEKSLEAGMTYRLDPTLSHSTEHECGNSGDEGLWLTE